MGCALRLKPIESQEINQWNSVGSAGWSFVLFSPTSLGKLVPSQNVYTGATIESHTNQSDKQSGGVESAADRGNSLLVAKEGVLGLFVSIAGLALSFLSIRWIIALGGEPLYGGFAFGLSLVATITPIATLGLAPAMSRFLPVYMRKGDLDGVHTILFTTWVLGCIATSFFGLMIWMSAEWVAHSVFSRPEAVPLVRATGFLLVPSTLCGLVRGYASGMKRPSLGGVVSQIALRIGLLIALASIVLLGGLSSEELLWGYGWACWAVLVMSLIAGRRIRSLRVPKGGRLRSDVTREYLKFSLILIGVTVVEGLHRQVDNLLIAKFLGLTEVGTYTVASRLTDISMVAVIAFMSISSPLFSELKHAGSEDEYQSLSVTIFRWLHLVGLPLVLCGVWFPEFTIGLLGVTTPEGSGALQILLVSRVAAITSLMSAHMLFSSGYERLGLGLSVASVLMNLGLDTWLIPQYGIEGAAFGTLVTVCFSGLIRMIAIRKCLGFLPFDFRGIQAVLLTAGLLCASGAFFRIVVDGWIGFLGCAALNCVVVAGIVLGFRMDDDQMIIDRVRRKFLPRRFR